MKSKYIPFHMGLHMLTACSVIESGFEICLKIEFKAKFQLLLPQTRNGGGAGDSGLHQISYTKDLFTFLFSPQDALHHPSMRLGMRTLLPIRRLEHTR